MAIVRYETTVPYRNNLLGGSPGAATIDAITDDLHHFDFSMKWTGADGAVALSATPAVDLQTVALSSPAFTPAIGSPIYLEWQLGTLAGTIKENYYSFASLVATRDNIDPGYGTAYVGGATPDAGRDGPRYTFAYFATRFEAYVNFKPGVANIPIVSAPISSLLPSIIQPYRLQFSVPTNVNIRNVTLNAIKNFFKASFRVEDQVKWFGSQQTTFYVRMYEKGISMNGVPIDIVTP